jgi:predicted phosphodiesterase
LVLLGDIWDWWLIPLGEAIPHPSKLFQSTDAYGYNVPQMTSLIKKIGEHMQIYAVRGNHDDENNHRLNQLAFGPAVKWMEDAFEMNGIWFEHGNIIDMYSTPPVAPDGQKKKGFAYFETRAGAEEDGWQCRHKTKRPAGEKEERYIDFMRKAVEFTDRPFLMDKNPATIMWSNWYLKNVVALPQNFVKTHLRWVLKQANPGFKNSDYESVPVAGFGKDHKVEFESRKAEYTLGDAIKDHTYDMELMANKFGSQHALARLYASGLENHFKWFKASRNHMLVVTGHTHNPYISRMRRDKPAHSISDDVVYANSGAWAQDSYQRDHTSFVDIHMDQLDQPVENAALHVGEWYPSKVALYEYPDNVPRDEQAIPFPKKRPGGFDLWLHPDPNELVVGKPQNVGDYSPPAFEQYGNPKTQESGVKVPWMAGQPLLKYPQPSWEADKEV